VTQNPLLILLSAMVINNIVLVRLVGLCPIFNDCTNGRTMLAFGTAATAVMILTAVINSAIHSLVLVPYHLLFLRIITFVAVILVTVHILDLVLQKASRTLHDLYDPYVPALCMNCAVLAVNLLCADLGYNILQGICFAAGSGLGLTLVTAGFFAVREKLELAPPVPALRGYPLQFIAASLMALAIAGFRGFLGIH
jgi:electron transport complex protein RnfA